MNLYTNKVSKVTVSYLTEKKCLCFLNANYLVFFPMK